MTDFIEPIRVKRAFLWGMIGSLILAAGAGVWAILTSHGGELTWRIIGSMLLVALCSGVALAAIDVMEKHVWRGLMGVALGFCAVSLLYFMFLIWLGDALNLDAQTGWAQAMGVLAIWTFALPCTGQVAATPTSPRMRPIKAGTLTLLIGLSCMLTAAIFTGTNEAFGRLAIVMIILTCLGAITLRILQRVEKMDEKANVETTPLQLTLTCPRCLLEQTVSNGPSRCQRCRLKFHIEIEEPRCPQCNYLLHQLTTPRCPECGAALAPEETIQQPVSAESA